MNNNIKTIKHHDHWSEIHPDELRTIRQELKFLDPLAKRNTQRIFKALQCVYTNGVDIVDKKKQKEFHKSCVVITNLFKKLGYPLP